MRPHAKSLNIEDSLVVRNGFEPPVPVIRAKVAASCQFRFSVRTRA